MSEMGNPSNQREREPAVLNGNIRILYEDGDIIVCRKPAGVPVQSANMRIKDMESILKLYLLEKRNGQKGEPYLGIVHRLDQPVQGVLVFAKTKKAAAELSRQMSDKSGKGLAQKRYCAVVHGLTDAAQRDERPGEYKELVDYLRKDGKTNTSHIVPKGTKDARESRLRLQIRQVKETLALVDIELLTGRHHQIRVQLSGAGMPIVGDRKYGCTQTEKDAEAESEILALCAYCLSFRHPRTGKKMEFSVKPEGGAFKNF